MRIENNQIRIRDFTRKDLPLMLKWLTDDRVLADGESLVLIFKILILRNSIVRSKCASQGTKIKKY